MDKSCLRKAFILWVLFLIIKGLLFAGVLLGNKSSDVSAGGLSFYNSKETLLAITPVTMLTGNESMIICAVTYAFDILTAALILALICFDFGRYQRLLFVSSLILGLAYVVYVALIPLFLLSLLIPYIGVSGRLLPAALPAAALLLLAKGYKKPDF